MRSLVRWVLFILTPPPEEEEATCLLNPVLFPTLQKEGVLAPQTPLFLLLMVSLPIPCPHLFSIKAFLFVPLLGAEHSSGC